MISIPVGLRNGECKRSLLRDVASSVFGDRFRKGAASIHVAAGQPRDVLSETARLVDVASRCRGHGFRQCPSLDDFTPGCGTHGFGKGATLVNVSAGSFLDPLRHRAAGVHVLTRGLGNRHGQGAVPA